MTDDDEFGALDQFFRRRLAARLADQESEHGKDWGICNLSAFDGLMTAVVSGPNTILPSSWLLVVWGEFPPDFESQEEAEEILGQMMDYSNSIVTELMESPYDFEPLFAEYDDDGSLIAELWCDGYMRGVALDVDAWASAGDEMTELLEPMLIFSTDEGKALCQEASEETIATWQQQLGPAAVALHQYWLAVRTQEGHQNPIVRSEPKVGRNDPCPCGSGKKYKHCCLQ